jgi:hypothetical protein
VSGTGKTLDELQLISKCRRFRTPDSFGSFIRPTCTLEMRLLEMDPVYTTYHACAQ